MPIARRLMIVEGRRWVGRYLSSATKPDVTERTFVWAGLYSDDQVASRSVGL